MTFSNSYTLLLIPQSVTKYMGLTPVSMWNSALQEKFNLYIRDFFASINKIC